MAMKPEDRDQGGRKGLRRGLSGKKKEEEGRGNPQEPELRASSHCSEQLRREGAVAGGLDGERKQYMALLQGL